MNIGFSGAYWITGSPASVQSQVDTFIAHDRCLSRHHRSRQQASQQNDQKALALGQSGKKATRTYNTYQWGHPFMVVYHPEKTDAIYFDNSDVAEAVALDVTSKDFGKASDIFSRWEREGQTPSGGIVTRCEVPREVALA